MLRLTVLAIACQTIYGFSSAQENSMIRYTNRVFKVDIQQDIRYADLPDPAVKPRYYLMDIYQPADDPVAERPLIIWLHGGGFKYGNKKTGGLPLWCNEFTKRGYICASINYRLSKNKPLRRFPDLIASCVEAMEDLQKAIDFFKKNYKEYRVDTNRIVVAGNSAGGMIALQAVYSSPFEMMQLINKGGYDTLSKQHNPGGICAVVNFWGAMFDSSWLKNEKIPIVSVHGEKDRIVPFDHKGPVNGSLVIHRVADSLGIPNSLKSYPGYGHELQKHFNPFFAGKKTKRRWKEAADFAAAFLFKEIISR